MTFCTSFTQTFSSFIGTGHVIQLIRSVYLTRTVPGLFTTKEIRRKNIVDKLSDMTQQANHFEF